MYRARIDRSAGLGRKGEGDVGCASLGGLESNNCISDLRGFVVMSRGNAVYNTTEMQISKREEQHSKLKK